MRNNIGKQDPPSLRQNKVYIILDCPSYYYREEVV